jgi:hypothetical protein
MNEMKLHFITSALYAYAVDKNTILQKQRQNIWQFIFKV